MTTPPHSSSRRYLTVFYVVVAGIALTGAGLAATTWLGWWWPFAFAAVGAVELGGVVISNHAGERMRLAERAIFARLLSAAVAAGAVCVNWFGHQAHVGQAAFFAGMSALGYLVWLIDTSARRRDQLRALKMLADPPPAYGLARWLRHPWLTREARALAVETPALGLHGSIAAAVTARRVAARQAAIAKVLHRKIRAAVDPTTADIAVAVYDLDEVAARLAAAADYDGITALIGADLAAARIAGVEVPAELPPAETPAADREPVEKPFVPATPDTVPASAPTSGPPSAPKRTVDETRYLAELLLNGPKTVTKKYVAEQLGISSRRLQDILRGDRKAETATELDDTPWPEGQRVPETTAALVAV